MFRGLQRIFRKGDKWHSSAHAPIPEHPSMGVIFEKNMYSSPHSVATYGKYVIKTVKHTTSLVPGDVMLLGRYTRGEIVRKLSGNRLAETVFKMANLQICKYGLHEDIRSVPATVITDLERPVLKPFRNEDRMFLTMVLL